MKYVVWGAPGAGKTSIATQLGIPDRFHGDESLAHMVFESRGADIALIVFDVTVPAQVQAARSQVAARQAGIGQVIAAVNKMDLAGYEYESFKAARSVFLRGWHGAPPVFLPVSARFGDLLLHPGNRIDWYAGPTLAELLGIRQKVAA
jgi:sulfate adenylyltransferase subunit 1 (EFTu-like GTPase family)